MFDNIKKDIRVVLEKDPAARNWLEVVFTYSGYKALRRHRKAHWFHNHNLKFFARLISQYNRFITGIEIHPGAKIAHGVFIDHGMGVVIGETAEIATGVTIYQGVTLGGTGKDKGKRHPTIEEGVMISSGAKILGPFTVGAHSKIGAGSVVLKAVPAHSTVVGVPGRIVRVYGEKYNEDDMDQIKLPDPIMEEFKRLNQRIQRLEEELKLNVCRYSITNEMPQDLDNKGENNA